ncbi:hypothetical protein PPYR_02206 [Photinus pyralis]|uniref:Uncharacterized protein n=2 Tax=Photinus pyralis TaxID=7054 RepID=A0A5N4B6P3_PHOPY|nr:protein Spindly-B-like isoform X2 [Photinus pyralis]XP_031329786.1 protein Spindly-B-like isoform X2 [Photinus pyralis]KAB0805236.1 hypothetical protein PPYR_02206 [Photinus pyralis]
MDSSMTMNCERLSLLEKELEAKKQEVHEMRNKIAVAVSLEADYLSEIQAIRLSNLEKEAKIKKEIKVENLALIEVENKLVHLDQHDTLIKDLMCQKLQLELQITEVDNRREEQREAALMMQRDAEEVSILMRKVVATQEEIDALNQEATSLQSKEKELDDLIEEQKEILTSTKAFVSQKRDELSLLQDKYSSLKMAVESVDSEPLKLPTQGNSLFAEVHDSEMKLRAGLSQLEKYYMKLDIKHSSLAKELEDLRVSLVNLCAGLKGIHELDIEDETIKQLKSELEKVRAEGENYKSQVKEKYQLFGDSNPDSTTQYFTAVIMEAWLEIASDVNAIIGLCLEGLDETVKLTTAKQEERTMQRELVTDKVKLVELRGNYRKADLAMTDVAK